MPIETGDIAQGVQMKRSPKLDPLKLTDVMGQTQHRLGQLLNKAKRLSLLQQLLPTLLPEALQDHVQVMNIHQHELVLCASNSTIASALRLHRDRLISAINRDPMGLRLNEISIKVRMA